MLGGRKVFSVEVLEMGFESIGFLKSVGELDGTVAEGAATENGELCTGKLLLALIGNKG